MVSLFNHCLKSFTARCTLIPVAPYWYTVSLGSHIACGLQRCFKKYLAPTMQPFLCFCPIRNNLRHGEIRFIVLTNFPELHTCIYVQSHVYEETVLQSSTHLSIPSLCTDVPLYILHHVIAHVKRYTKGLSQTYIN